MKRAATALGALAIVTGGPTLVLDRAAADATTCFAALEHREDATLPDCRKDIRWLEELPFVGRPAQLDREEMEARQAAVAYLDAAIGQPDRAVRAQRFADLEPAYRVLEVGSGQLRLDRLGPPLPAPEPGLYAAMVGDRDALVVDAPRFTRQEAQRWALRTALTDRGLAEAAALASHYLEAADDEVRLRAAALRCAVGDGRGMDVALAVERGRAKSRTESFSRAFGGARVIVEACGEIVDRNAPEVAPHGGAGAWDQRARFMAMRLRQLRTRACEPEGSCAAPIADNLAHLRELLDGGFEAEHRLAMVALLDATDASEQDKWLPELEGAPRFADELVSRRGDAPFLIAERWRGAAERVEAVAPAAAEAMRIWAAAGFAQRGALEAADAALGRLDRDRAAALRVAVALVAGRREEARARTADLPDDDVGSLLRAELALPDRARASFLLEGALASPDASVRERARWLRTALVEPVEAIVAGGEIAWVGGTEGKLRAERLDTLLAAFASARGAGEGSRRAFRHRLFREHRGDAPDGHAAWLFLLGTLVAPAAAEPFLDAMHAVNVPSLTLRQEAFARWQAASFRGDPAAAAGWRRRLVSLGALAQDPRRRDLLQTLDL
jgi:hypothetical protein